MNPILTLSNSPEPEVAQIIRDGLDAFNDAIVGYGDRVQLHVVVRASEDGEIIGGISGRTSLALLTINLVYLPETLRGTVVGTRMMAMAEQRHVVVAAGLALFTRLVSRLLGSINVWVGAFLARYRAIRRELVAYSLGRTFVDGSSNDIAAEHESVVGTFRTWRAV